MSFLSRREFALTTGVTIAPLLARANGISQIEMNSLVQNKDKETGFEYCAFVKFIQKLPFGEMADSLAAFGFNGIEATIRPGGMIEPDNVAEQLPELVKELSRHDLEVTVMTTSINRADDETSQLVLKVASDLGIKRYRTNYYRYDLSQPVLPQIEDFRSTATELAELNEELGITGLYQNHAGANYLGATIWDLTKLLADIDPDHLGMAFDIRHAIASGGKSWPVLWDIALPHLRAIYVKDFRWSGNRIENVPLGDGIVDPNFFATIAELDLDVPVSLHVEYLQKAGLEANLNALGTDLKTLKDSVE